MFHFKEYIFLPVGNDDDDYDKDSDNGNNDESRN
jgi:hypothetical protein